MAHIDSQIALIDSRSYPNVNGMIKPGPTPRAPFPHFLEVLKIIEGAVSFDIGKVQAFGKQLSSQITQEGFPEAAKAIVHTLNSSKAQKLFPMSFSNKIQLPLDSESKMPLGDELFIAKNSTKIVIKPIIREKIFEFTSHIQAASKLLAHGLGISPSMLLYGPPGCGKTEIAKFIASVLELPILIARSDSLISSYLGSTSKNIRSLFEYASSHPCILFLDEFDALAKLRDDQRELGELKRVVISLLQNIDALGGKTILLAATNHHHLLDPAIWRRFAYKVIVEPPSFEERKSLFSHFLNFQPNHISHFALLSEGLSGADIREISMASMRSAIIKDLEMPDENEIIWRTFDKKFPELEWASLTLEEKAYQLKKIDDTFTNSIIAEMLNVSRGYVSKLVKKCHTPSLTHEEAEHGGGKTDQVGDHATS